MPKLTVLAPNRVTLWITLLKRTSVACAVGPTVNPLQNRETQHANIVLQCMY